MNFQAPLSQADLTASLLSAALLQQTQSIVPITNNLRGVYRNSLLQTYQSPLPHLVQQPLPFVNQIKLPLLLNSDQIYSAHLDPMNPLLSNHLLNSYRLSQMSQINPLPNYLNGLKPTLQEPQDVSQANTEMLSGLIEKYKFVKPNETSAQNNGMYQLKNTNVPTATPIISPRLHDPFIKFNKKRLRRKAIEIERAHKCPLKGCEKSYGTEASMLQHFRLKHPEYVQSDPIDPSKGESKQQESKYASSDLVKSTKLEKIEVLKAEENLATMK